MHFYVLFNKYISFLVPTSTPIAETTTPDQGIPSPVGISDNPKSGGCSWPRIYPVFDKIAAGNTRITIL